MFGKDSFNEYWPFHRKIVSWIRFKPKKRRCLKLINVSLVSKYWVTSPWSKIFSWLLSHYKNFCGNIFNDINDKIQGRRHRGAGGAMAPPIFLHLCSKSRNLLSQLYKWPPQYFGPWPPQIFEPVYGPANNKIYKNWNGISWKALPLCVLWSIPTDWLHLTTNISIIRLVKILGFFPWRILYFTNDRWEMPDYTRGQQI